MPVTSIRVELKWQLMVNRVSKDKLFDNEREDNPKGGGEKDGKLLFQQFVSVSPFQLLCELLACLFLLTVPLLSKVRVHVFAVQT